MVEGPAIAGWMHTTGMHADSRPERAVIARPFRQAFGGGVGGAFAWRTGSVSFEAGPRALVARTRARSDSIIQVSQLSDVAAPTV